MFSSPALLPARRAVRAVLHSRVSAFQVSVTVTHRQAHQRRQYAMRAPSLSRRSPRRPVPQRTVLFKTSDIPEIDLWRGFKSNQGLGDLTPEDALKAVIQYCDIATDTSSAWKEALETDHNIDPYTLHYAALPLVNGPASHNPLGIHMLMTASSLGYTPSTLTLMAILTRSGGETRTETTAKFRAHIRDAESRFKRLLRTENNPDALTLQGVLLLQEGRPESEQLLYYNRAIEAARSIPPPPPPPPSPVPDHPNPTTETIPRPREPRWTYEGTCHYRRGLILLKQGHPDQAKASFQIVALELGLAEGYVELAKLLPASAPERETYLLKAAQAGNFEACRLLAVHLADKAADAALPRDERVFAARMAQEWAQVDPDGKRREGVVGEVLEKTGEVLGGRVWVRG